VPVLFVDPTATSKRCHRCGTVGHRYRKRFECPTCGLIAHADVNAAINIAFAPSRRSDKTQSPPSYRRLRREARRTAGATPSGEGLSALLEWTLSGDKKREDAQHRDCPVPGT
jgi:transposase